MIVGFTILPGAAPAKTVARRQLSRAQTEPADPPPAPDPAEAPPEDAADATQSAEAASALENFEPASAKGKPDAPCDLAGNLAADLQTSPAAREGASEIPNSARSVANAVMLWNGLWPNHPDRGAALLRAVIEREVEAARPDCSDQLNSGPMFFFVSGDPATVLALGSGQWRWSDLTR